MHDKLDSITTKLKDLVEEKVTLGLSVEEETRSRNINRRLQTSVFDASSIIGRQAEKEALVQKLLGDEPSDQNFSIVPIVGMGWVGKTTLARLLYDDKKVKDHFELNAWVCVSDEFDSFNTSKVIFQSVTGVNKEFADLNLLQVDLRDHLGGKIFLLVLDDIWIENYEDWVTLVGPLHACAPGSKIIITTRKEQLLKKLGYGHVNHRLLRTKEFEEEYWKEVLNNEIWRLQNGGGIIPALRLSYDDLSSCLKQLFIYCSLFPKDYMFEKEELVLLWMAEGFLHQSTPSDTTEEHLGHEYFDELLSRSFFQHAPNSESLFVMHDLMNNLATSMASEFFVRLDNETEKIIKKEKLEKYRHMSFVREEYVPYKKFEAFTRAKGLRTFLATSIGGVESSQSFYLSNKIMVDLLPKLPLLRVLCLSHFQISEVPESIGTMRHLRYLNLSQTSITHLPKSVCGLYNLQTLIVFGCHKLAKLPNNFLKLKKLRHFDIRDTPLLDKMPLLVS
ncbi:putative P-loop containing nucleoside triphosphate hydrolase, leucine-rich repeat domain superfamily [Helianthus annuus]|nr:putative P-loop containing nucleoside triphosphate hydrolase, leucine-rich repeat domain superfamily [Helianthus annuus]